MDYSNVEIPNQDFDFSQYILPSQQLSSSEDTQNELSSAEIERILAYGKNTDDDLASPIYQEDFQSYFSYLNIDITDYIDPEIMPLYNDCEVEAIAVECRKQLQEEAMAEITASDELGSSHANINIVNNGFNLTNTCGPLIQKPKRVRRPTLGKHHGPHIPKWNVYKCGKEGCEFRAPADRFCFIIAHLMWSKDHDKSKVTISWVGDENITLAPSFRPNETLNDRNNRMENDKEVRKNLALALSKINSAPKRPSH